jgi:hypothetical protein
LPRRSNIFSAQSVLYISSWLAMFEAALLGVLAGNGDSMPQLGSYGRHRCPCALCPSRRDVIAALEQATLLSLSLPM